MERVCFALRVREGMEDEYDRRHGELWPELAEAMRETGIRNYTLFRDGREVVGVFEAHPDAATVLERGASLEIGDRWARWMEDVLEPVGDLGPPRLREIWHLD